MECQTSDLRDVLSSFGSASTYIYLLPVPLHYLITSTNLITRTNPLSHLFPASSPAQTQEKGEEVEKLNVDIKNLEDQVATQVKTLTGLEIQQESVRQDLEAQAQAMQASIAGFQLEYKQNMAVVRGQGWKTRLGWSNTFE